MHFPDFEDKKVKIKVGDTNEKYDANTIDSIQIYDADKKLSYTFLWTKTKEYKKKGTEHKVLKERWLCKTISGKASLYLGGEEYGIKEIKEKDEDTKEKIKKSKMQVVTKTVNHYLKRNNEDYPTFVSISSNALSVGYNAFFKRYGFYYFNDNPEIANKINDKEYTYDDIEKVVNLYNAKPKIKAKPQKADKTEAQPAKIKPTPKATSKTKNTK